MKFSAFFAAFVMALTTLTYSNTASASTMMPVDVDFSFSTVSGTLTFDGGIGDPTADAITFSSNNFGENTTSFDRFVLNTFVWAGNDIDIFFTRLDTSTTANDPFLKLRLSPSGPRYSLECSDVNSLPFDACGGGLFDSISGSAITFTTNLPPAVPLPAGLPLVLTGLAGFAGLRMRKKRKAQV